MSIAKEQLKDQLLEQFDNLSPEQQRRLVEYAQSLGASRPRGVPGRDLLRFAGMIDADDLRRMAEAIDNDCEQIDLHEW